MSYLTVLLNHPKIIVTLEDETIRIDSPDKPFRRVPLKMIGHVIIEGKPLVACDVFRALTRYNIPTEILPVRGKGEIAYIGSGIASKGISSRIQQHFAYQNKFCALDIARWLVDLKIGGQQDNILQISNGTAIQLTEQMNTFRKKAKLADSRNSLMGFEGNAASIYFKTLGGLIPERWKFKGRNRRPPRDPVNALLSLGYVLATTEIRRIIQTRGLDPALGFLHVPLPERESLVLDILEPIRPVIDRFVISLIFHQFSLNHFSYSTKDGCRLNKQGRSIFYGSWADWRVSESQELLKTSINHIIKKLMQFFPMDINQDYNLLNYKEAIC